MNNFYFNMSLFLVGFCFTIGIWLLFFQHPRTEWDTFIGIANLFCVPININTAIRTYKQL